MDKCLYAKVWRGRYSTLLTNGDEDEDDEDEKRLLGLRQAEGKPSVARILIEVPFPISRGKIQFFFVLKYHAGNGK